MHKFEAGFGLWVVKFWRADEMQMINHRSGKSTELTWSDYKFQVGFKEKDFNKNSLKRAR